MKLIAITGRSGSGKSSVTALLARRGYAMADADLVAREVLLPGSPCLALLQKRFGADIVREGQLLDRHLLADRAFATPEGTVALTKITFPEIQKRILARAEQARQAGAALFFIDGAVIVGTPFETLCDALILVTAPYEVSVARICARDGITEEQARRRLDAQLSLQALRDAADYEIDNDGPIQALEQKLDAILIQLLPKGAS